MNKTCKSCLHRIKMASGRGLAMYCDIHASRRTHNGHLRVKCNQPGCDGWSQGEAMQAQPSNQLSLFD